MTTEFSFGRRELPPYGPAKGMVEGLQLMTRLSPTRVDERLLRMHRVAPRNEYKVVGALRYLGLIDADGRPTEASRLLKTRGPAFEDNMQAIVKRAYRRIFDRFELTTVTRDDLFNYFVTEEAMGTEMAVKALRFFVDVCKMAGFEMNPALEVKRGRKPGSRNKRTLEMLQNPESVAERNGTGAGRRPRIAAPAPVAAAGGMAMTITVTPELMLMDEDRLTEFFQRVRRALERAFGDEA
jgi:hypothetical protein